MYETVVMLIMWAFVSSLAPKLQVYDNDVN